MRSLRARARDAIYGAFLGDAAALGLHWLYDVDAVARHGGDRPEFFPTDKSPYHAARHAGQLTHYGDHALVMLESLAACDGFDAGDYRTRLLERFGAADYDGYLDAATKALLQTSQGADDNQAGAFAKLPMLVARHLHGRNDPLEEAIRVTHDNAEAVMYGLAAADAIGAAMLGAAPAEVVMVVAQQPGAAGAAARRAQEAGDDPVAFAVQVGQSCPVSNCLPVALHAALHGADFKATVRASIRSGGDTAGRLHLAGAIGGACDGVPPDWWERVEARERIEDLTRRLLDRSGIGS